MTVRTGKPARKPWLGTVAILAVLALVVVAGLAYWFNRPSGNRYSAMVTSMVGVYPGSDVRVLGVPVGTVDSVVPEGKLVRVNFHVDSDVKVPANAMAAIVAPTVVADRYLQLAPPYTGGPTMQDGAVIPKERTAAPAEYDELLASAQKLTKALGPRGVNDNGALSEALSTFAKNLNGNGEKINTTLGNLSQATTTLSASRENLAGTILGLQSFTTNLKANDGQVREFTERFAQVNRFLAGERENLADTIKELTETLDDVAEFVRDNRKDIRVNVDRLGKILERVNDEKQSLHQVLDTAPMALNQLANTYNASSGTIDARANTVLMLVCQIGFIQEPIGSIVRLVLTPLLPPGTFDRCPGHTVAATSLIPQVPSALAGAKLPAGFNLQSLLTPGSVPAPGAAPPPGAAPLPGAPKQQDAKSEKKEESEEKPKPEGLLGGLFGGGR